MKNNRGAWYVIAFFALLKFIIPYVLIHPAFELHRDEYLYLADADHLAWGYIEMPPLLAFLGFISKLFGGSIYTVYFWGGFSGALTTVLVGMIVLKMGGKTLAVFFACLAFVCSAFLRMHILFQPNFLDIFFWTWASYLIIRWIDTDQKKYLYWLGVCFGLGILGKYSTAFYIIAFVISVLLTRKRKWLLNPHFYGAMLTGVVICLPNLIWQYTHGFPVMHHMDLLTKHQLRHNSRTEFLVSQLLFALPCVFVWTGGLFYLFINRNGRKYMMIGIIYFGIIGLLLWFNGKGYYAAAIYPVLMASGGVWLAEVVKKRYMGWISWAAPAVMILLIARILPVLLPYRSPEALDAFYRSSFLGEMALKWEDGRQHPLPQDFADMLGWKEMAEKTARVYHSPPDSVKRQTMLYGNNYGEAGALNFYRKPLGLPEAFSDNASYIFWMPDRFTYKYFLFVTEDMPDADDIFFNHWGKRQILDSVTQRYAREYNTRIILYSEPDDSARLIAEQHTLRDKQRFRMR